MTEGTSRWDHWVVQTAVLVLIIAIGVFGTALLIEIFYHNWLLERETRLLWSTVMLAVQMPYLVFLYWERERHGGLFWWLVAHCCLFVFDWFWNVHHLYMIHKQNGVYTSITVTGFIWLVAVLSTALYIAILYFAYVEWRRHACPEEREVLPEMDAGGIKTKRLPTVIWEPYKNLAGIVCVVCLKGYKAKHPMKVLPECFHTMHAHCASEWFRLNSNCPHCKARSDDKKCEKFYADKYREDVILSKIREAKFSVETRV